MTGIFIYIYIYKYLWHFSLQSSPCQRPIFSTHRHLPFPHTIHPAHMSVLPPKHIMDLNSLAHNQRGPRVLCRYLAINTTQLPIRILYIALGYPRISQLVNGSCHKLHHTVISTLLTLQCLSYVCFNNMTDERFKARRFLIVWWVRIVSFSFYEVFSVITRFMATGLRTARVTVTGAGTGAGAGTATDPRARQDAGIEQDREGAIPTTTLHNTGELGRYHDVFDTRSWFYE